ncbi:MAG: hypothetical protein RJA22_1689 [Verrucomicrobiota bacterium]|jgi:arylsulfatase A-like enzyme
MSLRLLPLATLLLAGLAPLMGAPAPRPNIIFIMADDLGWRDVGFAGNPYVETPHLDRLAKDGLRFTQAYQQTVCSPTRAALLTGQHPVRVNMTDFLKAKDTRFLSPDLPTLPKRLMAAGYRTGLIGKWHLTDDYTKPDGGNGRPQQHGWDEVICSETRWIGPGYYFPPYQHQPELEPLRGREYLTERLNHEAVEFIGRNRNVPFFLYLAHYAPHTALRAREEFVRYFEKKPGAGKRTGPGSDTNNPVLAAMIRAIDDGVGEIRAQVESLGLAGRTLILFTSDNGGEAVRQKSSASGREARGVTSVAPLRGGKSHLYEGGIRVPLVAHWPGVIAPGRVEATPVNGLDFYPTWLELAGAPAPSGVSLDGHSLVPLLRGTGPRPPSPMFWHYPRSEPHFLGGVSASALRDGDWKLLRFHADQRLELYNLRQDEGEKHNLAAQEPERARQMAAMLDSFLAGAQPRTNPAP